MSRLRRWGFNATSVVSIVLFLAACAFVARTHYAQDDTYNASSGPLGQFEMVQFLPPGHLIQANDLIVVELDCLHEANGTVVKTCRVCAEGKITLPHGKVVAAQGLTAKQLENAIGKMYRGSGVAREPLIDVQVADGRGSTGIRRWANIHYTPTSADITRRFADPLVIGAFLFLIVLVSAAHSRHRSVPGLCPACGYDLRATPHRCPECATMPKGAA